MKRLIVGVLFILVGGGVISWSSRTSSSLSSIKEWPTEEGRVISSKIVEGAIGGGKAYHADVVYRFSVNGGMYESNVFSLGIPKSYADRAEAEKLIAAHPVGSEVTVYYEAGNPARSSLEPGAVPQGFGLMTLTSGIFLLIGLMLFVSGALGWARSELVGR